MIKITFNVKDDFIKRIEIKGHSGFEEFGKDVICASISTLTLNTINALEDYINLKTNAEIEDGYTCFEIPTGSKTQNIQSDALTKAFLISAKGIEEEYPKFLKVKITEE